MYFEDTFSFPSIYLHTTFINTMLGLSQTGAYYAYVIEVRKRLKLVF